MQERRNSIANALEYVSLAPSHPYKECHLWVPPTPTPHFIVSSLNAMKSIWQCLKCLFFIIGQCTEHIASHYIAQRHIDSTKSRLSNSWYTTTSNTYIDYYKSSWRCPVTQRFLDMSLMLCYSNVSTPSSDYLKMVGMDKYAILKM